MADGQNFDLIVIGAGPGGYVAAIRAAQLGLNVACIDKRKSLGGTCLNIGCIPSKALLQSSEHYEHAQHGLAAHGVKVGKVSFDLDAMMGHKNKVVEDNTKGIEFLFKKNKVTSFHGTARITSATEVDVTSENGDSQTLKTGAILIATGSDSTPLPGLEIDEKQIVTSTGALTLASVPKHLVVVGAGYIGLEMGSVWARLGANVTVIEFLDRITPGMDGEVAKAFQKILEAQGMTFRLGTKVTGAETLKTKVKLSVEAASGGETETIECDTVLVSIGRRPYTNQLGLDEAGITTDERGFIEIDANFQTNVEGIFAIGDCVPGPMLAHKAEDEGVAAAEIIAGETGHVNYDVIPGIVYTWPEVASVGKTEEQLKDDGVDYRVGKFPFSANGRARAANETDGFVKLLADSKTDRLLGAHIIGPDAGTLIHEIVVGMEFGASAEDIARTCHGHPTLSEAVKEAALAVDGRTIHI
ncbi:MAG: dihydrolipoyl dehydrogenase [Alphaproteobacteria bacterium]|jgi:dihydrolipoamide dehydrogenase|nr:dihydrolipoyl dehydrogenase [Alphaproteobacteria bacterium]